MSQAQASLPGRRRSNRQLQALLSPMGESLPPDGMYDWSFEFERPPPIVTGAWANAREIQLRAARLMGPIAMTVEQED